MSRTKLSVNINKIALIRNSRGSNLPDLTKIVEDCERFGADGITVHPRPDERHIRYDDLAILKDVVKTEFNIEGYPSPKFMKEVLAVKPHQCTLVPDPPGVLTSNTGWDVKNNVDFLSDILAELKSNNIRASLFLNPDLSQLEYCKKVKADRIELYTGKYATQYLANPSEAVKSHIEIANEVESYNLGLNAGHDLNLNNLLFYKSSVPQLLEVSIGHALVCDALYYGLSNVIQMYKRQLIA